MQIVDLFYELARQHRQIRGFFYGKAYDKGAANEAHPLVWLDDPIAGRDVNQTIQYTCNVDILGIPSNDAEVLAIQNSAFVIGLSFAEKIKRAYPANGFKFSGFTFVSLRDYYDNAAAGFRFTYTVTQANPVNRCNDDFDPDKQFPETGALPSFQLDSPQGCAVFNDKSSLPNFKLTNPDGCE